MLNTTTTFTHKNGSTVKVVPCTKWENGKLFKYHIEGTERYYIFRRTAIEHAKVELLRRALPKEEFEQIMEDRKQLLLAKAIVKIHEEMKEHRHFINKWNTTLSVANIQKRHKAMVACKNRLKKKCKASIFENVTQARKYLKANLKTKK